MPRASVGSDHAGIAGRRAAARLLHERGYEVEEIGPAEGESADYPEIAHRVAERVAAGEATVGVLVCGSGQGMAMAANRHPGIRAAILSDEETATLARAHNDANIACFGERKVTAERIPEILGAFLASPFEGGRHQRRVEKIEPSPDRA